MVADLVRLRTWETISLQRLLVLRPIIENGAAIEGDAFGPSPVCGFQRSAMPRPSKAEEVEQGSRAPDRP